VGAEGLEIKWDGIKTHVNQQIMHKKTVISLMVIALNLFTPSCSDEKNDDFTLKNSILNNNR
jgi:hypothetical protein